MTRPKCHYKIGFCPKYREFKPEGCGTKISAVEVTPEEAEALRLKDIEGFDQTKSAEKMKISQSTFQRLLSSAHKKVSEALIKGKIIKITEGNK